MSCMELQLAAEDVVFAQDALRALLELNDPGSTSCVAAGVALKQAIDRLGYASVRHRNRPMSQILAAIKEARDMFRNDGTEGETVHLLCDELERRL